MAASCGHCNKHRTGAMQRVALCNAPKSVLRLVCGPCLRRLNLLPVRKALALGYLLFCARCVQACDYMKACVHATTGCMHIYVIPGRRPSFVGCAEVVELRKRRRPAALTPSRGVDA